MTSPRNLLVLMGLILGLGLGLRRSTDISDHRAGGIPEIVAQQALTDPRTLGPSGSGLEPGGSTAFRGLRPSALAPGNLPWRNPSMVDSGSSQESSDGADWPLDSMIRALETASAPDELGLWADRIAARGGSAAVEALVRLSLSQDEPERALAIREAFKGLSTEEELAALVERLPGIEPPELIEAVVETLARGARASTLQGLVRLHGMGAMPEDRRWVVAWAIERVRNPEASTALAELASDAAWPELADAAIIAGASLRIGPESPEPEVSP